MRPGGPINSQQLHYFSQGCPQGSCLGLFMRVTLIETLLSRYLGLSCTLSEYGDDVLLLAWRLSRERLERDSNEALKIIEDWANLNGIQSSIKNLREKNW